MTTFSKRTSIPLLDPTGEHHVVTRKKAQRPLSLEGGIVGVLDIGKMRGDIFLDRVAELLKECGIAVNRYSKPGPGKLVSNEVKSKMITDKVQSVVVGLAD